MKIQTGILFSALLSLFLVFAGLNDAEARRFGGGSSFGGRSSYSAPYQRSAAPTRSATQQQQQAGKQSPAAARPSWANRGLMGMLGGLAIGGLLGSMFMGGGFHGLNFMDMLVFGGIAFFLYRMFAARKAASAQRPIFGQPSGRSSHDSYQDMSSSYQQHPDQSSQNSSTGFNTDILFGKDKKSAEFVRPKRSTRCRFQHLRQYQQVLMNRVSWLAQKSPTKTCKKPGMNVILAEIRGLTTDKVFAEIQDQINASTEENHTDILKLEAEILEVREIGNEIEAVILFDTVMREDREAQAGQVQGSLAFC